MVRLKAIVTHISHLPWRTKDGCVRCAVRNEKRVEREIQQTMDMLAWTLGDEIYLRRRGLWEKRQRVLYRGKW